MSTERNSFYPAAKKVFSNKVVKSLLGIVMAGIVTSFTTGIYPFFKGWVITRASVNQVEEIDNRVVKIENDHEVDFKRLNYALNDDTGVLNQGEQIQWLIIRVKRLQERLVIETRSRVALEARLKMPRPNSDAAQRIEAAVKNKYDEFIRQGETPNMAAQKALEAVYGRNL